MSEETMVRDELAKDRTKLANERTFLAYLRTALALTVLAAFIFKFVGGTYGMALSLSALVAAGGVAFVGLRSYRMTSLRITGLYQSSDTSLK